MKLGAFDYIVKPFDLGRLNISLETAIETKAHSDRSHSRAAFSFQRGEQCNLPAPEWYRRMNAIACGVEARFELLFGYSKIVTQETIDIARQLGIPDKEVQGWGSARQMRNSERDRAIRSSLHKLERNLLAQKIMGLAPQYLYEPKTDGYQN
jgi:YesN/AraC family two-component response regulator